MAGGVPLLAGYQPNAVGPHVVGRDSVGPYAVAARVVAEDAERLKNIGSRASLLT